MKKLLLIFTLLLLHYNLISQNKLIEQCEGTWVGEMYIYNQGTLKDSVNLELLVSKTDKPNEWVWKTHYFSEKMPMTKDYKLRKDNTSLNCYITDEGDGIELKNYVFANKLYNVFETQGITLTSSYELIKDNLVFEVTSGRKIDHENKDIVNYSVLNLQRVVFTRKKH